MFCRMNLNEESKIEPLPAIDVLDEMLSQYVDNGEVGDVATPTDGVENLSNLSTYDPNGVENMETDDVEEKDDDRLLVGKTFFILGFNENDEITLKEMIEENGGLLRSAKAVDYLVVPLVDNGHFKFQNGVKYNEIVTNCWLQMCIERNNFLPVDGHPLFKPIKIPPNCRILNSCVICISQYTGAERDALKHLAETLGAKTQEHFSRQDKKDSEIYACTHLIFVKPEGAKYLKASEWNIPSVNVNWLIQCALTVKKLKEKDFLTPLLPEESDENVSLNAKEEQIQTNENRPVDNLNSSSLKSNKQTDSRPVKMIYPLDVIKNESKRRSSDKQDFGVPEFDTPSKFTDPNRSFHPNFDLTEGFEYLKHRQSGKRQKLESPSVVVERQLALAVESTSRAEQWLRSPAVTRKTLSLVDADDSLMSFNSKKSSLSRVNLGKQLDNVLSRSKTSNSITNEDETGNQSPTTTSVKENAAVGHAANSDSQGFRIGWEDPNQKQQRAKIQPLMKQTSEPTQNLIGGPLDVFFDDDDMGDVVELVKNYKPESYRFMLTSSDEVKQSCIEIIKLLNGKYLEARNFVSDCTHLIVSKPTRNEKLLASIATGKFILHPSYLVACKEAKRFVQEDDYEWGGEGTSRHMSALPAMSQSLAKCCKRWRVRLATENIKPYDGWRVVLNVDRNIENGLKTLLEHGGATLCTRETTPSNITHAFFPDKVLANAAEIKRLKKFNVKCMKAEYLAAYLIQDPVNDKEFFVT